jgi:hypothetical protein
MIYIARFTADIDRDEGQLEGALMRLSQEANATFSRVAMFGAKNILSTQIVQTPETEHAWGEVSLVFVLDAPATILDAMFADEPGGNRLPPGC